MLIKAGVVWHDCCRFEKWISLVDQERRRYCRVARNAIVILLYTTLRLLGEPSAGETKQRKKF